MPSRKGMNQAITWLKSKMAEADTLDAINAEVTYNVLMDLQRRKKAIGAMYHLSKVAQSKDRAESAERSLEIMEDIMKGEAEYDRLRPWQQDSLLPADIEIPEEWRQE